MPIPEHEMVPKKKPGPRKGAKSNPQEILKRVVMVGKLLHIRGMTLTEIYEWNLDPARATDPDTGFPYPGGNPWGFGFRHITEIVHQAQKLGGSLLCKNYDEALRRTLRDLYDIKNAALAGGDYRCAYMVAMQIAKIQDTYLGKAQKAKTNAVTQEKFEWARLPSADAAMEGVSLSDYDRIIGPPPRPAE